MLDSTVVCRRALGCEWGGKDTHGTIRPQSQARVGCAARSRQGSAEWVSEHSSSQVGKAHNGREFWQRFHKDQLYYREGLPKGGHSSTRTGAARSRMGSAHDVMPRVVVVVIVIVVVVVVVQIPASREAELGRHVV